MTVARRLLPGRTHAITRRCAGRRFLLKPVPAVNDIVFFALALAASRHPEVKLHAFCAEASHHHMLLTDGKAGLSALPQFFGLFHSLTARAINAHWGRGESMWRDGSYSNVEVWDDAEGLRAGVPKPETGAALSRADSQTPTLDAQLLYVWTQAVRDGLVERPEDWPGAKLLPEDFGRTFTVRRPATAFFGGRRPPDWEPTDPGARSRQRRARRRAREEARRRDKLRDRRRGRGRRRSRQLARARARRDTARVAGPRRRSRQTLPEVVSFRVAPPPGYEGWPIEDVRAHFRRLLDEELARIRQEREEAGLTHCMGVEAILAQSPFATSGDSFPRFSLDPRVACKAPKLRMHVLAGLVDWRRAYRAAYLAWREGDRQVVFPCGAYAIRKFHSGRVAAPPRAPPGLAT